MKRIYQEKYRQELTVPRTFREYNQIAAFFTEGTGFDSNVRYGTHLTLGNTGVAATEFLARFFSHKDNLYDESERIVLQNEIGKKALEELVEAQKYAPGKTSKWWTNTAKDFANGNVAMMINFSNYASEILGYNSKIVGNVGFAMVPAGIPSMEEVLSLSPDTAGIQRTPWLSSSGLLGNRLPPRWLRWEVFPPVSRPTTSMTSSTHSMAGIF